MMEFFSTVDKFIIYNKGLNQSLWCCKLDGSLIPQHGMQMFIFEMYTCLNLYFDQCFYGR